MQSILKDKINDYRKGTLSIDALLPEQRVVCEMARQWQVTPPRPEESDDDIQSQKQEIWSGIVAYIKVQRAERRLTVYRRFSAAATILVVLLGSYMAFLSDNRPEMLHSLSTGNQDKQIVVLEDGTRVTLGPNSSFQYPEKFSGKNRKVTLNGQAFFNVAADASRPFSVRIGGVDVTALGTSFEVFLPTDKQYVEAILQTGKIRVDYLVGNTYASQVILPNHKLTYNYLTQSASVISTDATKYSEWTSRFGQSFKNEQLQFVVPRLERWYGVKIRLSRGVYDRTDRFTFKITDESLEHILGLMQKSSGVKWQKNQIGDQYWIY